MSSHEEIATSIRSMLCGAVTFLFLMGLVGQSFVPFCPIFPIIYERASFFNCDERLSEQTRAGFGKE